MEILNHTKQQYIPQNYVILRFRSIHGLQYVLANAPSYTRSSIVCFPLHSFIFHFFLWFIIIIANIFFLLYSLQFYSFMMTCWMREYFKEKLQFYRKFRLRQWLILLRENTSNFSRIKRRQKLNFSEKLFQAIHLLIILPITLSTKPGNTIAWSFLCRYIIGTWRYHGRRGWWDLRACILMRLLGWLDKSIIFRSTPGSAVESTRCPELTHPLPLLPSTLSIPKPQHYLSCVILSSQNKPYDT